MGQDFILQPDEKIILDIKPNQKLRWYFMFDLPGLGTGLAALVLLAYALFSILPLIFDINLLQILIGNPLLSIALAIPLFLVGSFILSMARYRHQHYWITSKRIIYRRGIIGYRITSIPLERISDVIISRTFAESLFGFGSLHIQSLAGQISGTSSLGSEGTLLAIPEPEKVQELIFQLVKQKRSVEKLTM